MVRKETAERVQDVLDALHLPLFLRHAAPQHRFVRIEPEDFTGRRFPVVDPSAWAVDTGTRRASGVNPVGGNRHGSAVRAGPFAPWRHLEQW